MSEENESRAVARKTLPGDYVNAIPMLADIFKGMGLGVYREKRKPRKEFDGPPGY